MNKIYHVFNHIRRVYLPVIIIGIGLTSFNCGLFENGVKLYVMDCGTVYINDVSVFNPSLKKGERRKLANPCYLIQHKKGTLVWDTGIKDSLVGKVEGEKIAGGLFEFYANRSVKKQLQEIGIKPADVTYIAFSHLHLDHTGNAKYFNKAQWLIQKEEYDLAFSENAQEYAFVIDDYVSLQNDSNIILNGDYDIFGDGTVTLITTPGHTPGHQSLLVKLKKSGNILLGGDVYHFQENRETRGVPVWNDKHATLHSMDKVENIVKAKKAKLWIQHDQAEFEKRTLSPKYYD